MVVILSPCPHSSRAPAALTTSARVSQLKWGRGQGKRRSPCTGSKKGERDLPSSEGVSAPPGEHLIGLMVGGQG